MSMLSLSYRSCAAWCLICTVTVLLAAATMGVNILHPGAGLGQQLALSGKNRALAEVRPCSCTLGVPRC